MGATLHEGALIAGRYRLDRLLGKGGMGAVWAATHIVTRRSVAIKLLLGPLAARPEMRLRFLREARAAARVSHPNVVEIFDVFQLEDDTPVMVMALLSGETLGARLSREGALPLQEAVDLMLPVVSAVGAAHARGVVHRDLKPDNVFLVQDGAPASDHAVRFDRTLVTEAVKVLDFGIAKLDGEDHADLGNITGPGILLGTPYYMAPEQAFGEHDVDHRADVWSLGVILYETLSGVRPLEGDNLGQVLKRVTIDGIEPIEQRLPALPGRLASLIMRMLAFDRHDRPSDLREAYEILSAYSTVNAPAFDVPTGRGPGESVPPSGPARPPQGNEDATLADSPHALEPPTVDPVAPTEALTIPLTPATRTLRAAAPRSSRRWLLAAIVACSGAAFVVRSYWRPEAKPMPVLALSSARASEAPVARASATVEPARLSPESPTNPPPEAHSRAGDAASRARSASSPRRPAHASSSARQPARDTEALLVPARSAPTTTLPSSDTTETRPAPEGLHEEPPF